ncbi:MAG TPA: CinA family nicotinamide mononucleotide deamidase-related protein, partial [Dehalococcoidales bacterium]
MKAEIIASGTELLLGEITDTNTPFIANQLADLGIDLYYVSIVGDNYERFVGVLKQALGRSDLIIITGGLGPTKGDITREVIAGAMNEKLAIDPVSKQRMVDFFARLHLEMPENNLKQAAIIPSATALPNPLGSAPGWWVAKDDKIIVSLPGPPSEMQPMWQNEVVPRLGTRGEAVIVSRTLKTWGLSEARIDQMVGHFMSNSNPTLALYAKQDGIHLRITAKAPDRDTSLKLINTREIELRNLLQDYIWGSDRDNLEEIVSTLIINHGLTVAAAESVTGGLLAYSISNLPASQSFFKGGLVISDDRSRAAFGITTDTVEKADSQSAALMAATARERFGSGIGLAIDGYLGQSGGSAPGKAFIAIDVNQGQKVFRQTYPAGSYLLIRRSVTQTFFALRQALL